MSRSFVSSVLPEQLFRDRWLRGLSAQRLVKNLTYAAAGQGILRDRAIYGTSTIAPKQRHWLAHVEPLFPKSPVAGPVRRIRAPRALLHDANS